MSDRTDTEPDATEPAHWTVYQCPNGCVHVQLTHVTLRFSEGEFRQLVRLLGDAYVRLGVRETMRHVLAH